MEKGSKRIKCQNEARWEGFDWPLLILETEEEPGAKEHRQHLEDGKDKEGEFPLEPSEERNP